MSVWEEMAKDVSDAAFATARKGEQLTRLAKLRYRLHSENAHLDECFEMIGRLYYEYQCEGTDNAAEIALLIQEIDEVKKNIVQLKREIIRLKKENRNDI